MVLSAKTPPSPGTLNNGPHNQNKHKGDFFNVFLNVFLVIFGTLYMWLITEHTKTHPIVYL